MADEKKREFMRWDEDERERERKTLQNWMGITPPKITEGRTERAYPAYKGHPASKEKRWEDYFKTQYLNSLPAQLYLFVNSPTKFKNEILRYEAYGILEPGTYEKAKDDAALMKKLQEDYVSAVVDDTNSIIASEGIYSPNLPFYKETIQPQVQEIVPYLGEKHPELGVNIINGKYVDIMTGQAITDLDRQEVDRQIKIQKLNEDMRWWRLSGNVEKWGKMAEMRRKYFDTRERLVASKPEDWIVPLGTHRRKGDITMTAHEIAVAPSEEEAAKKGYSRWIPEEVVNNDFFQNMYESKKNDILEGLAWSQLWFNKGTGRMTGGVPSEEAIQAAMDALPDSTKTQVGNVAAKEALTEAWRNFNRVKGIPSGGKAEGDWQDAVQSVRKIDTRTEGQKRAEAQNKARARAREDRIKAQRKEFQEFASFMKGGKGVSSKGTNFGAMSNAEQQALMEKYGKKYNVKEWPILPGNWGTMPFKQRENIMSSLTTGMPYFNEGKVPSWMSSYAKKSAKNPRYTSAEEVNYFMGYRPAGTAGTGYRTRGQYA